MLYYLLFWTILGFIFHFYIIFGTNLLTGGPAQNCCFFAYFSVSKKRNIKRSPNGINLRERDFLTEYDPGDLDPTPRKLRGGHEVGGRALHPQSAPPPSWAHRSSTDILLPPIYTYVPPNDQIRSQKPNSTATTFCIHEIPSWACSGAPSEGESTTEGFYIIIIAPPMKYE